MTSAWQLAPQNVVRYALSGTSLQLKCIHMAKNTHHSAGCCRRLLSGQRKHGRQKISLMQGQAKACPCNASCHMCDIMQDLGPGSIDEPLIEGSRKFLTQACQRLYRGKSAEEPDVMLKLGNKTLPAHRALLAVSSDYFRAMFKVSSASQKVLLHLRVHSQVGPSCYR